MITANAFLRALWVEVPDQIRALLAFRQWHVPVAQAILESALVDQPGVLDARKIDHLPVRVESNRKAVEIPGRIDRDSEG
ncbi:MAG: hypothetical protein K8R59_14230 [Thermoanaerobaculales bacterium]|nr:hypothetical protein [Thermoanaerobaculales bacterium]